MIISHFLGTAEVTPYAVAFRLFTYASLLQTILAGSLTPAYTEAFARGDSAWIRKTLFRHLWLSGITTTLICGTLYAAGPLIIRYWAGTEAIPTGSTLAWMAAWNALLGVCYPIAIMLCGLGEPKRMTVYGGLTAALNLLLSFLWVTKYGVVGVVAASTIAFLLFNVPLTVIECVWRLRKMEAQN